VTIELLVDTCAVLDLIRAPVRNEFHPTYAAGVRALLAAAQLQNPPARIIWTDVTLGEYQNHVGEVTAESLRLFKQIRDRYQHGLTVHGALIAGQAQQAVDDTWVETAINQTRALADAVAGIAVVEAAIQVDRDRAMGRVFKAIAPSRKGKDSLADCVITEVALRHAGTAAARGVTKSVFFSSNTAEYCEGGQLKASLQAEFDACGLIYVRTWGEAHHSVLGPNVAAPAIPAV
jgi:hypothetical protein